ncbi:hypothetical protein RFI_40021, partial [Reticulomyxa filosa]
NNINLLEIECNDVYSQLLCRNSTNVQQKVSQNCHQMLSFLSNKQLEIISLLYSSNKKPYYKTKKNFFDKKCGNIMYAINQKIFQTSEEEEEAFFKSLLEECLYSLIPCSESKDDIVRMSQSKHPLKYVQEYLRMAHEVTIDKESLDYLNHHEMFYICGMTDSLQYWMIVVEKKSFVVCCENGGLSSNDTLSSLKLFKIIHHNIASICLNTAKSMMHCNDIGRHFVESFHGHDFLIEDLLMYSGKLLMNETVPTANCGDISGIENVMVKRIKSTTITANLHLTFEESITAKIHLEKFGTVCFFQKKGNIIL